ncbi:type II toxin-antitoxin system ParD family antitoxin [Rhizobium sp. CB3171]|uniref:type II toxin-antitoxin system ParD family antitoxin n=1 Tax=unclassified Rhizobium TaxID=2613769 RepID=UPI000CDF39FF|nr:MULTISPECIES: type II toxin-antitoxin system ParD family antitoxin [Rhizobium]AVA20611.1 antitoxin ParD 1 [Rhizobium sp. NXC24]UWU21883.1 type II toxin-antitoxin system ParD family antitoxin [Rhizobium tropici]WFU02700.1 type II toxin-antitoxin system ParD family antitoxin [Rhizobium sp. CB3171]
MNVSIGDRWEKFIEKTVEEGRYSSASEVVREGLRLVEEREAKIASLRLTLEASIASGGDISDEELDASLDAVEAQLKQEGY